MRIAYMLTSLGIGGAEKQVIAIGERMEARGHDVALVILRSAETHECPTSLPIHRLGIDESPAGIMSGLIRARQVLRSFKPDLLHSHTFPANMMARTLRSAGLAPLVLSTIHNIYEGAWHRTLAYRITDPFCTHTTAISQTKETKSASDETKRIKAPASTAVLRRRLRDGEFVVARIVGDAESSHSGSAVIGNVSPLRLIVVCFISGKVVG